VREWRLSTTREVSLGILVQSRVTKTVKVKMRKMRQLMRTRKKRRKKMTRMTLVMKSMHPVVGVEDASACRRP
jgi:hypothetical protein